MNLQVGVKVLLRNREGKYLLVKRSRSRFKGIDGTWDIVGGRIQVGTILNDNLKRETKEEVGLEILSEPELLCVQDILWHENNTHVVRITYVAETDGQPNLDRTENVAYEWLTIEQIKRHENLDKYFSEALNRLSMAIGAARLC